MEYLAIFTGKKTILGIISPFFWGGGSRYASEARRDLIAIFNIVLLKIVECQLHWVYKLYNSFNWIFVEQFYKYKNPYHAMHMSWNSNKTYTKLVLNLASLRSFCHPPPKKKGEIMSKMAQMGLFSCINSKVFHLLY